MGTEMQFAKDFFTACKEKRISLLQRGQNITITDLDLKTESFRLGKENLCCQLPFLCRGYSFLSRIGDKKCVLLCLAEPPASFIAASVFDLSILRSRRHFLKHSGKTSQRYAQFFGKFFPLDSRMHGDQSEDFCLNTYRCLSV